MEFGKIVVRARQRIGMSQKDLAARLRKEDGSPISPQYLHDIEKGRRNPPSGLLLTQMAQVLNLPEDYLRFAAGELPKDLTAGQFNADQVLRAFGAMRNELSRHDAND